MTSLIQEGDQVVFRREGSSRVFEVRKKRQVYYEKSKFFVDELIGQPYGSTFEIDRNHLVKTDSYKVVQLQIAGIIPDQNADNRNLLDTESNQKMTKDDIMKLKDEGTTGKKIIEELIENSETFRSKTEFSQAKYLKKKKQKHLQVFTVLQPTPRLIMEIFAKEPAKICYLRPDTLSQLLSFSNVMCGNKVAVVETCQGLVLACVLQRLGGQGRLIQLIPNENHSVCRQVMDYFSFPQEHLNNLHTFPLDKLSALTEQESGTVGMKGDVPNVFENAPERPITISPKAHDSASLLPSTTDSDSDRKNNEDISKDVIMAESDENASVDNTSEDIKEGNGNCIDDEEKTGNKRKLGPLREKQKQQRASRQKEAGDIIRAKQLDSLILACKYNPAPILMKMLEFLAPSCPVVVFCQFLEPLVECYTQIKEKHVGIQLKLSETWYRAYQVLPQRTHPMINMSGTGGYLLTFMTTQPSPS